MAINFGIKDVRTIVNQLHNQMTDRTALEPTNTGEFVSQATALLGVGVDNVYNELMVAVSKVVFSTRNYAPHFKGLYKDELAWGGIVRKVSMGDKDTPFDDKAYHDIIDGQSVDHYVINKPDILELRFYGSVVYQDMVTYYRTQVKNAFRNESELAGLLSLIANEMNNKWTQWRENFARGLVCNYIGAKVQLDNGVVHLLSEYNEETQQSLTKADIFKKENVKPFFEWVKARVNTYSRRMTERSGAYQVTVKDKKINRFTPYDRQHLYMGADYLDIINATVLPEAYHNEGLKYVDVEGVSYWQAFDEPEKINVTPNVINENGEYEDGSAQEVDNIFGVLFDTDAMGIHVIENIIVNTPLNARGLYYDTWLTSNMKYTTDLTEKGLIFLMD